MGVVAVPIRQQFTIHGRSSIGDCRLQTHGHTLPHPDLLLIERDLDVGRQARLGGVTETTRKDHDKNEAAYG